MGARAEKHLYHHKTVGALTMPKPYSPYIPKGTGELLDLLSTFMSSSPRFEDTTGYFPSMSIDTEFFALNEALKLMRKRLGEERYLAAMDISDRMRAHFEADPEDKTDDCIAGRELIHVLEDILKSPRR